MSDIPPKLIKKLLLKLATLVECDPKAPFFNSYNTEVLGRNLLFSLVIITLPLMLTIFTNPSARAGYNRRSVF